MPGVTLTEEEIEAFARERLSAYKIPRIIKFVDALPKGPSGKILKRAIDVSQLSGVEVIKVAGSSVATGHVCAMKPLL